MNHSVHLSPPYPPPTSTTTSTIDIDDRTDTSAVTVEEFSTLLTRAGIPPTQRLAVALSGGADSTALALLAHHESHHSHGRRPPPLILQVDHRLRPESTAETLHCADWLAQLTPPSPPTHIVLPLHWTDGRPAINRLQQMAAERRRAAMVEACTVRGVQWLLLAHHADDQMETIVHRWTRGSGLYGLVGMAVARPVNSAGPSAERLDNDEEEAQQSEASYSATGGSKGGMEVILCRPLLSVHKARLVATCRQYGVRWVEDGSNNNRAFERIRIRQALSAMLDHHSNQPQPPAPAASSQTPLQPLTADLLESVPAIVSACQQSVHTFTTSLLRRHATLVSPFSIAYLSTSAISLPFPILLLLFSRLLAVVRGSAHLPLGEPLRQLVRSLLRQHTSRAIAAHKSDDGVLSRQQGFGCVVSTLAAHAQQRGKRGGWMVARTLERIDEVVVSKDSSVVQRLPWDDRFLVHLHLPPASVRTPLGCHSIEYVLRPLRKADLSLFEKGSLTAELRHVLLTGLPLLVRRWRGYAGEEAAHEDVVLLPHVPFLPMRQRRQDKAELIRRDGDDEIQLTVTRLKHRASKWDWTQDDVM